MNPIDITVITPTYRLPEGLIPVEKGLKRQTFKNFEWIVVAPDQQATSQLSIPHRFIQDPPKLKGDVWALNKAYNKAIEESKGDLIVSIQDYTFFDPDTLEKFWFHFQTEPKTLVTGVGNKYTSVNPLGECVWEDPRITDKYGSFYPCYWTDIEWNFCSVPKKAVLEVGGFDPEMDKVFGLDAYSVDNRIEDLGGYDFKINQTIRSYSLEHGRPPRWDELNAMHGFYNNRVVELKSQGKWPVIS